MITRRNGSILLFLALHVACSFASADASSPLHHAQNQRQQPPAKLDNVIPLSRSKLYRWRQGWKRNRILQKRVPEIQKRAKHETRTRIFLHRPNPKEISDLFWDTHANTAACGAASTSAFNHPFAGMTNPCLHVGGRGRDSSAASPVAQLCSSVASENFPLEADASLESSWFPETVLSPEKMLSQNHWRILRFRRRVGQGEHVYQAVRDAALQWEFTNLQQDKAVFSVDPPPRPSMSRRGGRFMDGRTYSVLPLPEDQESCFAPLHSDNVHQIWSGPGRKLVTYSSMGFRMRWMPKLHALNPVSVVYDALDQRGPGTTYTATAYATGKGHWLRGEERVVVALRDNGAVDVEVLSVSKPAASFMGFLVWPLVGGIQQRFFNQQMEHFERIAQGIRSKNASVLDRAWTLP